MKFAKTSIPGIFIVSLELLEDDRGFFARSFCRKEFSEHGLNPDVAQCSVSFNRTRGTLRGMHFQKAPHEESKLIRCTMGSIYDVLVDVRPTSSTFKQWIAMELSGANRTMLFVPPGVAHGFLTLEDNSEVFYQMSEFYVPEASGGFRWNDPAFGIRWPEPPRVVSPRDQQYPDFGS